MKLSEALVLRADIQKRIEQLRERLKTSALVQEGERPPEDPQELLAELDRLLDELAGLIARINRTNLGARLLDGSATLTDALAQRDVLKLRHSVLQSVADAAVQPINRYSRTEIRSVPTVDVGALRRQVDEIALRYRTLDTAIQAANWATELLD
jgi:hypothetical protein